MAKELAVHMTIRSHAHATVDILGIGVNIEKMNVRRKKHKKYHCEKLGFI